MENFDLSQLSDEDLDNLLANNISALSDEALQVISPSKPTGLERLGGFLGENLEIPGAIAGAGAGAAIGTAVLPGIGTIIGGIIGGATGSFGGSLASNAYQDEALDFEDALSEAKTSVIFDAATLGLGKVVRPIAKAIKINTSDLIASARMAAPKPPDLRMLDMEGIIPGSPESVELTQRLLGSEGASLSAAQTGQASYLRTTAEEIGRIGIFSGSNEKKRAEAVNSVLQKTAQSLIDGINPTLAKDVSGVGETIYGIIEAGRQSASKIFGEEQNKLLTKYGNSNLPVSSIKKTLDDFLKRNSDPTLGNMLPKATQDAASDLLRKLEDVNIVPLSTIFNLEKMLSRNIDQAMPGNQLADPTAVRTLSELRNSITNATESLLSNRLPQMGSAYKSLKSNYSQSMDDLLPVLNRGVLSSAKKGDYEKIGKLLLRQTDSNKINKMLASIDRAFADIQKAGKLGDMDVKTAAQAKKIIAQSFAKEQFLDAATGMIDFKNLAAVSQKLSKQSEQSRIKAVMGDSYDSFKLLSNAIYDSSQQGRSGLFNLAIRSQEINSLGKLAQGAAAGGVGATVGIPLAIATLTIPSVFSKLATNKAAVNRLVALDKQIEKASAPTAEFISSNIAKIIEQLDENDQQSIREDIMLSQTR
jgi:hypothetical protein